MHSSSAISPSDYTYIPVPTELVLEVYAWLSAHGRQPGQETDEGSRVPYLDDRQVQEHEPVGWPPDLVARMYRESPDSMKEIISVLARRPGETVYASELLEPLGRVHGGEPASRRSLAGTLGAFGRRVLNRYGRTDWPFQAKWNYERGEMGYRMDGEVAEQILDLSGESG